VDPKEIVRAGYDTVSDAYRDDQGGGPAGLDIRYADWLAELIPRLTPSTRVLDLGCGCGLPTTKLLAERFRVTGVDFSPLQIERARRLVPRAQFLCADMTAIDFPRGSFDAVVSFYAIIHVPQAEHRTVYAGIRRWLRPGGLFLATIGAMATTGIDDDYLGAPMYWSHPDLTTSLAWLADLGFEVLWTRFIPEANTGHTLLLARSA